MACDKPPLGCPMQMTICQLCGLDMQSNHDQHETVNYQKQIDPPRARYSQVIPDSRYDEDEMNIQRRKGKLEKTKKPTPLQVCVPLTVVAGKTTTAKEPEKNEKSDQNCEKEKEKEKETEKEKEKDNQGSGSSPVTKAACFPDGGAECGKPVKMMLCLPCPPPPGVVNGNSSSGSAAQRNKPRDYTYRCESRELRGGNLYSCCQCIKRNGLQHDCPRTPCQGRSACLAKPWPDCWPSGGCHGIDFSREKGTKRYDPCREARFDKKECKGPGGSGGKAEFGGNMMVVVCPPPPATNE